MSRAIAAHRPTRVRVDRRPGVEAGPGVRLLPGRIVAYAWLLAGVPIAALQLVHAGLHERIEPPPLLHWLRDTGLAVPAAAVAVALAALIVSRAWSAQPRAVAPTTALLWAALAAGLFALLSMPGHELHGFLFGAEEETGADLLADLVGDGLAALQAALLVLTPLALIGGVPWRDTRIRVAPSPLLADAAGHASSGEVDA